jgi:predicted ATPase
VTFDDLSPEAQQDFKDYYRQGRLVVSARAVWNDQQRSAEVKQYGERLGIQRLREFFEQDKAGASVGELKDTYQGIKADLPDLPPPGTKARMLDDLRKYEAAHAKLCSLIPSEDQFYGVSRGANRLQKYLQWVFIPAVKDASTEQLEAKNTALGKLLARTVRSTVSLQAPIDALQDEAREKYAALLGEHQNALDDLSESLRKKLQAWAHEDAGLNLKWQSGDRAVSVSQPVAEVTAREGVFEGQIVRFGHGLQRSFIFALLQELSGCTQEGPKLILGCEEPELYQHPPQVRYLASLLQELSTKNGQVILCTHSPHLIDGKNFEHVRVVKHDTGKPSCEVHQATFEAVSAIIAKAKRGSAEESRWHSGQSCAGHAWSHQ